MNNNQRIFCVSHEPPLVPQSLFDTAIGIGDYCPSRGVHIGTVDPFWDRMRGRAYGAAGNYVIPRLLDQEIPPTELTGVFSHRKIIVRTPIGEPATKYPVYREISMATAASLPREEVRPSEAFSFLIGAPIQFPQGVVQQYAEKHRAIDLIDYLSIAAQFGILDADGMQAFFRESVFIPGGCELGIYPTPWLYDTLGKLERLGREFVIRCGERIQTYDSYQVRAVGFLAERLGSFLLIRELRRQYPRGIPRAVFGQLCVIIAEGDSYRAATASA